MPYIPRSSASPTGAIPKVIKKKHTFRIFGFLAGVFIVGALLSIVSAYAYKQIVLGDLEEVQSELASKSLDGTDVRVEELVAFEQKLNAINYLLDNHLSPETLFERLEESVKTSVRFTKFEYTYDPGFQAFLGLAGGTDQFASVAHQNIELMGNALYTEYVVGDVNSVLSLGGEASEEDDSDPVTFSVQGEIQKDAIRFQGTPLPVSTTTPEASEEVEVVPAEELEAPEETETEDLFEEAPLPEIITPEEPSS